MNFGFDIDGTITRSPEALWAIADALLAAGHEVHVLTGTMDTVLLDSHFEGRVTQLLAHGFNAWSHLHIVLSPHAKNKAQYCVDNDIVLMFEDSETYSEAISKVTTVFKVYG
jgi:ABC-type arginine/histidine transport system permease subunit